jgi:hypothetical protein
MLFRAQADLPAYVMEAAGSSNGQRRDIVR